MPELPEVETIVRGLRPALRGRAITGVWGSGFALRLARAVDLRGLRRVSVGRVFVDVRRRGKYIALVTARGAEPEKDAPAAVESGVCIHLGMTGRLRVVPSATARAPHTHVVFSLEGGDELRFVDPRRFGWVAPGAPLAALPALPARLTVSARAAAGASPCVRLARASCGAPRAAARRGGGRTRARRRASRR